MKKGLSLIDIVVMTLGISIVLFSLLSSSLGLKFPADAVKWLAIVGGALTAVPYVCIKYARIVITPTKGELVLEGRRTAEKLVDYVNKKIKAIEEHGTNYRNHDEAITDATDKIRECIIVNNSSTVEVRLMAVAMRYSLLYFTRKDDKGFSRLLKEFPHIQFDVKIAIVRPEHLARFDIDTVEFDWIAFSLKLPGLLEALQEEWKNEGFRNVRLEMFVYNNMPHQHGFLINGEYLFLGRVDWNWSTKSEKPRLSVGSNQYRYYDHSTDAGARQIGFFRHWFTLYSKFDNILSEKTP